MELGEVKVKLCILCCCRSWTPFHTTGSKPDSWAASRSDASVSFDMLLMATNKPSSTQERVGYKVEVALSVWIKRK